jgi:hypothetical protein
MRTDPLVCFDLIAQRRYAHGKAAADVGDFSAPAEMFAQAQQRALIGSAHATPTRESARSRGRK